MLVSLIVVLSLILVMGGAWVIRVERSCLRGLNARQVEDPTLLRIFERVAGEPGALWNRRHLKNGSHPSLWLFEEPGAQILVLRGPASPGVIILSRGLVARISHGDLVLLLQQALLRLNHRGLVRATFGVAGCLSLLDTRPGPGSWHLWLYSEHINPPVQDFSIELPSRRFFSFIQVLLLSPIVDFFGRQSRAAPWKLDTSAQLGLQRLGGRLDGALSLITSGVQPQIPMS